MLGGNIKPTRDGKALVAMHVHYSGSTTVPVAHDRSCHINTIPYLIVLPPRTIVIISCGFQAGSMHGGNTKPTK